MDRITPKFDPETQALLATEQAKVLRYGSGLDSTFTGATSAGLPAYKESGITSPAYGRSTMAFAYNPENMKTGGDKRGMSQVAFMNPRGLIGASEDEIQQVKAHEVEHLLSRQNLIPKVKFNQQFDQLYGNKVGRSKFVNAVFDNADYLKSKYNIAASDYFNKDYAKRISNGKVENLLNEQFAALSALEQVRGVDLTQDSVLRKTLFSDPAMRETYRAMTGLRQTRLDPRDISPYTRVPEAPLAPSSVYPQERSKGFLGRLRGLLF